MEYVSTRDKKLINERTKAIMPVSLYGLSADLEMFQKIGKKYNIPIANDAAEAYGAECNRKRIFKQRSHHIHWKIQSILQQVMVELW